MFMLEKVYPSLHLSFLELKLLEFRRMQLDLIAAHLILSFLHDLASCFENACVLSFFFLPIIFFVI